MLCVLLEKWFLIWRGEKMGEVLSFEGRVAELCEADLDSLYMVVLRPVMLSMSLTGTLHHFDGSDAWTHDDFDVAHAALNELVRRARRA